VQRRPILAMLEPDASQEGGLHQQAVEQLITTNKLDKFKLREKFKEWGEAMELLEDAFDHAPDALEVCAALFTTLPVEWNRLPHFQDVTIRLIAQNGIVRGKIPSAPRRRSFRAAAESLGRRVSLSAGHAKKPAATMQSTELYLQGEAATGKIILPPPFKGRQFHLFCSEFNAGAEALALELKLSTVFVVKGKKPSALLTHTSEIDELASCDHMLVLLDRRTWTSGESTARFVEHVHQAMRLGVHILCVHEFPGVVGAPRFECDFGLMFGDDWTPAHLTGGSTNLYKEIALAMKGAEWRQPGFVAFASKLATSAGEHKPIDFMVPASYVPKRGPNKWNTPNLAQEIERIIGLFDAENTCIFSAGELSNLLEHLDENVTEEQSKRMYEEMLARYDANQDGQLSIEEVAMYLVETQSNASEEDVNEEEIAHPVVAESELEYNSRGSLILDERCTFLLPAPRSSLSAAASSTASLTEPVAALSEPSDPFLAVYQANRAMHQTAEAAALLIQRLYRAKNARRQAFFTRTGLDEARNELFDSMDQTSLKERASRETSRARHLSPKPISAVRRLSIRAIASLRSQRMPSQGVPHQAAETQTATLQDAYRVKKAQHKATDLSDLSV